MPGGGSFTYPTVDGTNKIAPQSRFLNIGQLVWNEYSVASNRLQLLNRSTNNANTNNGLPIELADNIVMMKAQYGVSAEFATWSTTPTMPVAKWINPSTYAASTNTNKDATIRAMRISVVARSAQKEKNADGSAATGTNCDATTAAPASGFSVRNGIDDTVTFNLSAETNWKCYRYRVVTLTIPLKNLLIQTFNTTTVGS